jgi:hypothetical protein
MESTRLANLEPVTTTCKCQYLAKVEGLRTTPMTGPMHL